MSVKGLWLGALTIGFSIGVAACGDDPKPTPKLNCDHITSPCTAADAGTRCDAETLVLCQADSDGCWLETRNNCATVTRGHCDQSLTPPACAVAPDPCASKPVCVTSVATCQGGLLHDCVTDADGCQVPTIDCEAATDRCVTAGGTPHCAALCDDDPICVGADASVAFCSFNRLVVCTDDALDGCLTGVVTPCGADLCDDSASPALCASNGSGATCADPILVPGLSMTFTGADFASDFGDNAEFSNCGEGSALPEAIFEVQLTAGQRLDVKETVAGMHSHYGILNSCDPAAACQSIPTFDHIGFDYVASVDETLYIAAWATAPLDSNYEIVFSIPTCGDGLVDGAFEECEDGNTVSGDGCDACAMEFGWTCDTTQWPSQCGLVDHIGTFAAGEVIPDVLLGPMLDGERAPHTITFTEDVMLTLTLSTSTPGGELFVAFSQPSGPMGSYGTVSGDVWVDWYFAAGTYGIELGPLSGFDIDDFLLQMVSRGISCGDGYIDRAEECDDGNAVDNDGCTYCVFDADWICEGEPTSCRQPVCGDGAVELAEECDDENSVPDDGCTACVRDAGWECVGAPSSCHVAVCGDGAIEAQEECDDNNAVDNDGCTGCVKDAGWTCGGEPSGCYSGGGETCDDPILLSGSGLYTFDTGTAAHDLLSYTGCTHFTAGNDLVFQVEVPMDGYLEATVDASFYDVSMAFGQNCAAQAMTCIDGLTWYSPGAATLTHMNSSGASETIVIVIDSRTNALAGPFELALNVAVAQCGNNDVEPGEACDDGNDLGSDGCTLCAVDANWNCYFDPSICHDDTGDSCSKPIAVTAPGTFTGTVNGFTTTYPWDLGAGCTTNFPDHSREDTTYRIDLSAGQVLTATFTGVVPASNQPLDRRLYLFGDCADFANTCLAHSDLWAAATDPMTLTYTATAAETVDLVVAGPGASQGIYDLVIDIQ